MSIIPTGGFGVGGDAPVFFSSGTPVGTFDDEQDNTWAIYNASISNLTREEIISTSVPSNEPARELANLYRTATDRGTTCVFVLRDNTPMGCWIIWDQRYDADTQTIEIAGAELFSYYRRRIIENQSGDLDDFVRFTTLAPQNIAREILGAANDINLTIDSSIAGSNPQAEEMIWWGGDAKQIGDAVTELSAAEAPQGFDFRSDITISGNQFIRRFLMRPTLGNQITTHAKFQTNIQSLGIDRRGDVRANDSIAFGGSQGPKRPYGRAQNLNVWTPHLQLIEQVSDFDEEVEQSTGRLEDLAASNLNTFFDHEILEIEALPSADTELSAVYPGDLIRIHYPPNIDPWYQGGLDRVVRSIGMTVAVPDTGGEEGVTLLIEEEEVPSLG